MTQHVTLDREAAIASTVERVREYARGRRADVERGLETPRLAALLVQKYGRGAVETVQTIFDNNRDADAVQRAVDAETARIDPSWREHDRERWTWRPADVADLSSSSTVT